MNDSAMGVMRILQARKWVNHSRSLSAPHGTHFRQRLRDELDQGRHDNSFPLKPQRILADLRSALADDDIVISDVGAHKLWLARLFPCRQPNTCIISNGFASDGHGGAWSRSGKVNPPAPPRFSGYG